MPDTATVAESPPTAPAESPPITALAPAPRALVALQSSRARVELAEIVARSITITEVKDKAGRDQCHSAAMECLRARTAIEKRANEVREDAKKFNQAVMAEERALVALIEPEERRLKALRDAWDDEQKRLKEEAARKERARVAALVERVNEIKGFATLAAGARTAARVQALLDKLNGLQRDGFEEFQPEADAAFNATVAAVQAVLDARTQQERESAELERQRQELEARAKALREQEEALRRQQQALEEAKRPPPAPEPAPAAQQPDAAVADLFEQQRDEFAQAIGEAMTTAAATGTAVVQIPGLIADGRPMAVDPQAAQAQEQPASTTNERTDPPWQQVGRPSDKTIVRAVAAVFNTDYITALSWLESMDFEELNR